MQPLSTAPLPIMYPGRDIVISHALGVVAELGCCLACFLRMGSQFLTSPNDKGVFMSYRTPKGMKMGRLQCRHRKVVHYDGIANSEKKLDLRTSRAETVVASIRRARRRDSYHSEVHGVKTTIVGGGPRWM